MKCRPNHATKHHQRTLMKHKLEISREHSFMFCLFWPVNCFGTEQKINRRVTRVGTFEVYVPTHVALRMFIMQVLASQLHFLANRNAGLAIPPLFWPVDCIKIGGHVVQLSGPTVYSLYCGFGLHNMFDLLKPLFFKIHKKNVTCP